MKRIPALAALICLMISCSTTRVLDEGQYRLNGNTVTITDDSDFDTREISNYIRQNDVSGGIQSFIIRLQLVEEGWFLP